MLFVSRSFIISLVTTVMGEFMEPVYLPWQNIKTIPKNYICYPVVLVIGFRRTN